MSYTGRSSLFQDIYRAGIMVAIAVALVMIPRMAWAHAALVQSSPGVNGTVQGPDVPVTLQFNSRVDSARSTLALQREGGGSTPLTVEKQSAPNTLAAHATGLAPGKYVIQWQALSTDGHLSRGQIAFEVK